MNKAFGLLRKQTFSNTTGLFPALLVAGAAVMTASCGNGDEGDGGTNIELTDANNYSSVSVIDLKVIDTAAGQNLDICWTDATQDLQCHAVDPQEDIDGLTLSRFPNATEADVESKLGSEPIDQNQLTGVLTFKSDHESTCTTLYDFSEIGEPEPNLDRIEQIYEATEDDIYLLTFSRGTTPGVGTATMLLLNPTPDSTNTTVNAETGCGDLLDFTAHLEGDPVPIPIDGPWVIDWRGVKKDSTGNDFPRGEVDAALVGFYKDLTVSDIEERIFDIEQEDVATTIWEIQLSSGQITDRRVDLAEAVERGGTELFPGFQTDSEGTWLLALTCSTCQNPAPPLLAVLEPTSS